MATNSFLQLNINNPKLNLTKNTYQNSDFTYLESYPFDNMLQPITTHYTTGEYYNLDGTLYNLVGKRLLKDGTLIRDFTNDIKTKTTVYEGKKFGNYLIDVDNALYYNGVLKRNFTNNHQDFFYNNSALIIDDKIYEYINGVETAYDFPIDFNFNKVQAFYNNGHFLLLEKNLSMGTDKSTSKSSIGVLGFSAGNLKYYMLESSVKKVTALIATGMISSETGDQVGSNEFATIHIAEGIIQHNSIRLTVDNYTIWRGAYNIGVIEKKDYRYFYYTVFPYLSKADKDAKPIDIDNSPIFKTYYEILAVQGFLAGINSEGSVYKSDVITHKAIRKTSSGQMTISNFDSAVYYNYDEAVVYGFKYELNGSNLKYITEFSNGNCLTMPNFVDSPNPTAALEDTGALVLRNSSGRALTDEKSPMPQYPNFTAYYKEGALVYYLYKGFPISMPAAFDECYIADNNTIYIYSNTSDKTYRINFSTTNELKVVKAGDNLFTNTVYPYYFNFNKYRWIFLKPL